MFELKIDTGYGAYREEDERFDGYHELIRNLKRIVEQLEECQNNGIVIDINGNVVGDWKITEE